MGKRKDPIEVVPAEVIPLEEKHLERLGAGLPVTRQDLDSVRERLALLREFVVKQLVKDLDYGTIPGTQKPSLYQPGAQKLARLFGLTIQKECTHREVDRAANFALFAYRATVYHARTGALLSQCEGACNSQEKKYASRYSKGAREETPIFDVLNTLMKMAQKRAMVGAVIEAVGASEVFTQDIDTPEDAAALGVDKPSVTRVQATVPRPTAARSESKNAENICDCGNEMMVSKYNKDEFYCNPKSGGCGKTKARAE